MYQLLAIDLDETLLTREKRITEENKKWIHLAIDKGITVVIATGRAYPRMKQYYDELYLKTPMIVSNGSEVWQGEKMLHKDAMKKEALLSLKEMVHTYDVNYWMYSGDQIIQKDDWEPAFIDQKWTQFVIRDERIEMLQEIKQKGSLIDDLEVTQSSPRMIEFTDQGISKASGMEWICNLLNIPLEKVMAIGDNFNDLKMLTTVGLGIAMGNAEDEIKEAADAITDTNERNGVAQAIQRYLLTD